MIASRKSLLARAQAEAVGRALGRLHPGVEIQFRWVESEGDQRQDAPLADAGGKGLFVKSIERLLLANQADLAVHSMKDMPSDSTPGLAVAAVPARGDVRDCLVSPQAKQLADLPPQATVGTSSPRRQAQMLRARPDLRIEPIRGNVDTRIRKVMEEHRHDATLLAVAGLQRVGLGQHAQCPIDIETMLPAACQGALAVQCRSDDHVTLSRCLPLNDPISAAAVHAERKIVAMLHGDCHSPIAALVQPVAGQPRFQLRVRVLSPDGKVCLEASNDASSRDLSRQIRALVEQLRRQGVEQLLRGSGI
ncbi:MAG: hydroxymethylbilane synthase [Phycisphaeraceae bacterium]|nr:hydroxymethylbilane synthase [Phycisphaeraceae bacterium]